jgi:hypothetical protein
VSHFRGALQGFGTDELTTTRDVFQRLVVEVRRLPDLTKVGGLTETEVKHPPSQNFERVKTMIAPTTSSVVG